MKSEHVKNDKKSKLTTLLSHEVLFPIEKSENKTDQQYIAVLARGLELLRCFTLRDQYLSNKDLSQMTGLSKPTIARLTYTLCKLGYIQQLSNSNKFQLSASLLSFGTSMLSNIPIQSIAQRNMQELANYANVTVTMSTRDRLDMVCLNIVQNGGGATMRRQVGALSPIHLSSMGMAYLASVSNNESEFLLNAIHERNLTEWPVIKMALDTSRTEIKDKGFCIAINDQSKDVNSVAVPLIHERYGAMVFNCSGPSIVLNREKLERKIAPLLCHMVANICSEIG